MRARAAAAQTAGKRPSCGGRHTPCMGHRCRCRTLLLAEHMWERRTDQGGGQREAAEARVLVHAACCAAEVGVGKGPPSRAVALERGRDRSVRERRDGRSATVEKRCRRGCVGINLYLNLHPHASHPKGNTPHPYTKMLTNSSLAQLAHSSHRSHSSHSTLVRNVHLYILRGREKGTG